MPVSFCRIDRYGVNEQFKLVSLLRQVPCHTSSYTCTLHNYLSQLRSGVWCSLQYGLGLLTVASPHMLVFLVSQGFVVSLLLTAESSVES